MNWTNKGCEFEEQGRRFKELKAIYIFGAGISGKTIYNMYADKIRIKGFIDNDPAKSGIDGNNVRTFLISEIQLDEYEAIVICTGQASEREIAAGLTEIGCLSDKNIYFMNTFFPVFDMYVNDVLCLPSVSYLPTTACNLRCKDCLNFSPLIKEHKFRNIERQKADLDLLFSKIDRIILFHISGGEPFLYPHLAELITYLSEHHKNKIGRVEMTTNATIPPSDALTKALADCGVNLIVDDYRENVPEFQNNFDMLIKKLDRYGVLYRVQKAENWISLSPFDTNHSHWNEAQLRLHFTDCAVPWQEYRDGKLWLCNYAAYAAVAGLEKIYSDEFYDLNDVRADNRNEVLEFRMGYSDKGYAEFCKRCAGYGNNPNKAKVAEQSWKPQAFQTPYQKGQSHGNTPDKDNGL